MWPDVFLNSPEFRPNSPAPYISAQAFLRLFDLYITIGSCHGVCINRYNFITWLPTSIHLAKLNWKGCRMWWEHSRNLLDWSLVYLVTSFGTNYMLSSFSGITSFQLSTCPCIPFQLYKPSYTVLTCTLQLREHHGKCSSSYNFVI